MPQIREYQSKTSPEGDIPGRYARPSDISGPGLGNIGESLMNLGSAIQERTSQMEVTDAYATSAKMQADNSVALTKAMETADPADADFSQKFLDKLKPQLDTAGEKYTTPAGQMAWKREATKISANFVEQSGNYQIKLAGVKGVQDFAALIDNNQILLSNNPTLYDKIMGDTISALRDPKSTYANIPGAKRQEIERTMKNQLADSAMRGYIRFAPELALTMLNSASGPAGDVTGEQLNGLKAMADVAIKSQEVEKRRIQVEMDRAEKERNALIGNQLLQSIYDPNAQPKLKVQDILYGIGAPLPPMGENSKETYIKLLDNSLKTKEIKTNPDLYGKLMQQIHSGAITDETPLLNAFVSSSKTGSGITYEDLVHLRKEVDDFRTPDGKTLGQEMESLIKGIGPEINKSNPLMGQDPTGGEGVFRFRQDVEKQISEYRKAGKNPFDLFNPAKPDYVGRPESVIKYQKSLEESVQTIIQSVSPRGSVPKGQERRPGETPQQYLDRIKKK